MEKNMFCFQCEQTAGCNGCTGKRGVCGKTADVAKAQDELTGALIGLAKTCGNNPKTADTDRVIIEGLFTTLTNVSFNEETVRVMIERVEEEKSRIAPGCGTCVAKCGNTDNYDMEQIWNADEDIRSLKSLLLFGIRGVAAYAYHAMVLGYQSEEVNFFLYKALATLSMDLGMEELLPVVLETGKVNLTCMELLDRANTETYGIPKPTEVSMKVEKGPFIVVTGHDLRDLKLLLEQTEGKGINIPYPWRDASGTCIPGTEKIRSSERNFGTAWQNQQKEFADLPGAILFTTNCLMPPKESYADRVFSTEVVSYPGVVHVDDGKDFTPVIEKALELGGFGEDRQYKGINGGEKLTTGFGHGTILQAADQIVDAVKAGAIRHFFLVGGCDGQKGRNYYTEFVKQTPSDTIILTLACGKYRFNDLDLGSIGGFPRIMDMVDNVTMPTEPSKWQSHLHKLSTAESMNFRFPWCFPGTSRRRCVSC